VTCWLTKDQRMGSVEYSWRNASSSTSLSSVSAQPLPNPIQFCDVNQTWGKFSNREANFFQFSHREAERGRITVLNFDVYPVDNNFSPFFFELLRMISLRLLCLVTSHVHVLDAFYGMIDNCWASPEVWW
jgi:hypothetical protein